MDSPPPPPPPAPNTGALDILPAPVDGLEVLFLESFPVQVVARIQAGTPDGCTTFHDLKTRRSGNAISIQLTIQRPKDAICAAVYGSYEKNVNPGTDFVKGQTYTVRANDRTVDFMIP